MATSTVSLLFSDLVGSTALLSEVGEETAETLRLEHFALVRQAIEPAGGREVKNLGDGLMVAFASAADAIAAAVAMQRAFGRRNRRAEHELSIRVGVATGDADVDDGDYFGVPVIQAARLCARAEGGEILASDLVRAMAGSRGGFTFESVGDLELKGLDEPVASCRVRWEPDTTEERPPVPARLAASLAPTFVGREAEQATLVAAWNDCCSKVERRVVLIGGEPGIGKTTLASRFCRQAYDDGALIAYGRSDEDLGIPYQPWIEALTEVVLHVADDVLAAHVADRGGHLVRLIPALGSRLAVDAPASSGGDGERYLLFASITDLLARVSEEQPMLIVLDDLHWADRPSLQLLRHIVTAATPMRVTVLGTFRDSEVTSGDALADLLAAFRRESGIDRITLGGLSDVDLLDLLEEIAGHEMTDEGVALRDAVLTETAGNPFFVGEILRHLTESGVVYQDEDGQWVGDVDIREVGLPVSVKEVVGRRLTSLGPDTERLLGLAAVIGRDFDIGLLSAVARTDEDSVIDVCDAAVSAAVLKVTDSADRYTFAHALIEHTLYDGLSPARRARAHRSVAEQLERTEGDASARVGELAYHWAAAVVPTDVGKAIHYAELAGQRALDQFAPEEAMRWYVQALEMLERTSEADPRTRAEILLGLGEAQRQCGIGAHRETLLDAAHLADEIDAVDLLVRAALTNSRGWQSILGLADHERIAMIDRALARLDGPEDPDRARLLILAAIERLHTSDLGEREALATEAVAVARLSGDPATLVHVLTRSCVAVNAVGTLAQREAWGTEACALADEADDVLLRQMSHDTRMQAAVQQGDAPLYRHHQAISKEMSARIGHADMRWGRLFQQVWVATLAGDLDEAERLADDALAFGLDAGQRDAMTIYGAQLTNIRDHQGRLHELIELIEQALDETPGLGVYRGVLAKACVRGGFAARVDDLLAAELATGFSLPVDGNWAVAFACWADAAVVARNTEAAALVRDLLAPYPDQVPFTGATVNPVIAHHLGRLDHLLGRHDEADAWFARAMAIHQRLESPLLITYTEAAWAGLLADRGRDGDPDRAREMAESAVGSAAAGGYGDIEHDARAALVRLGPDQAS